MPMSTSMMHSDTRFNPQWVFTTLGADTSRWVRMTRRVYHFFFSQALPKTQCSRTRAAMCSPVSWKLNLRSTGEGLKECLLCLAPESQTEYLQRKMLHSWYQSPSQKHKPAVRRGCSHPGLSSSSPHWLKKKKKCITCKSAHFLHKDRLTLQRSADISALVHLLMSVMTAVINQTREERSRDTNQKNCDEEKVDAQWRWPWWRGRTRAQVQRQVQPRTRLPSWQP